MPLSQTLSAESYLARHRQLAPTASVRVSPLYLGTMTFGDVQTASFGECSKETAFEILDYFYDAGDNFLDTANGYQFGQCEEWLGEWLALRDNRDEMVIATKYTNPYMVGHPNKIQSNYVGNGSKSMKLAIEGSLKRLGTTYVDVLYIHCSLPWSNAPAWVVSKANQYARDHGLRQFSIYSGWWNAARRDVERDILPMCREEGMAMAPFGVLNEGRFQTAETLQTRATNNPGRKMLRTSETDRAVASVLEELAKARQPPVSLSNIATAYVMHKTTYVFPVIGVRTLEHIKDSHAALAIQLSEKEIKRIESAYDFDYGMPHTYLSGTHISGNAPRHATKPQDVWITKTAANFDWVNETLPIVPTQNGPRWDVFTEMNIPVVGNLQSRDGDDDKDKV